VAAFVDFEGKIAVVTGGASGIGRELLLQLAQAGTHVATCDVDREALEESAHRARARARTPEVRITTHTCDVADKQAVERFADEVAAVHSCDAIHLLFNNAGVVGGGSFVAGSSEEWERTFAVSWFGVYNCTRAFLPMLLVADQGVLINTSSVNGVWASLGPGTTHSAYSSAKFAVNGFTESLLGDAPPLRDPGHARPRPHRDAFSASLLASLSRFAWGGVPTGDRQDGGDGDPRGRSRWPLAGTHRRRRQGHRRSRS